MNVNKDNSKENRNANKKNSDEVVSGNKSSTNRTLSKVGYQTVLVNRREDIVSKQDKLSKRKQSSRVNEKNKTRAYSLMPPKG